MEEKVASLKCLGKKKEPHLMENPRLKLEPKAWKVKDEQQDFCSRGDKKAWLSWILFLMKRGV